MAHRSIRHITFTCMKGNGLKFARTTHLINIANTYVRYFLAQSYSAALAVQSRTDAASMSRYFMICSHGILRTFVDVSAQSRHCWLLWRQYKSLTSKPACHRQHQQYQKGSIVNNSCFGDLNSTALLVKERKGKEREVDLYTAYRQYLDH